jgi:hypothetical protein
MTVDQCDKPFPERDLEDLRRFLAGAGDLVFVVCVVDSVRDVALDDFTGDVPRTKRLLKELEKSHPGEPSAEIGAQRNTPQGRCQRTRTGMEQWTRELRRRSGVSFALAWRLPGDAVPSLAYSSDVTREEALREFSDILDFHVHEGVSCLPWRPGRATGDHESPPRSATFFDDLSPHVVDFAPEFGAGLRSLVAQVLPRLAAHHDQIAPCNRPHNGTGNLVR